MDLSKVKVEIYDFLAVIIPGLLVICEVWITVRGWSSFARGISDLSASGLSVILLAAFAFGPLLQEVGDIAIKTLKGKRYFKSSRDELWSSPTGERVRARILKQSGAEMDNVDVAFDYCLTKISEKFPKRDLFVANSDMARALAVISCLGIAPLARVVLDLQRARWAEIGVFILGLAVLSLMFSISWARMKRFRELSEKTVFHIFLAENETVNAAAAGNTK